MTSVDLHIPNEWSTLRKVVLGHGRDMGPPPVLQEAYDPTSKWHLARGTFPRQDDVAKQLDGLSEVLAAEGVEVLRPHNIPGVEQIFARDVGVVIDGVFIRSRTIDERSQEWKGVAPLLPKGHWLDLPAGVQLEGGDVVVTGDAILVGVTRNKAWLDLQVARTTASALDFLKQQFPHRAVVGIALSKDDEDPLKCALHLDCAYMPLGGGEAIVCPAFFEEESELGYLNSLHTTLIEVSAQEAAQLQTNLLHLAPDTLLIDPQFERLSQVLQDKGYRLVHCPMDCVGRMGGLFRCTTLPLLRRD